MYIPNSNSRCVKIARPRVITKASPKAQYLIDIGICQLNNRWKMFQEILKVGNYCSYLSLLQHYF
jgi:hypothetical protein